MSPAEVTNKARSLVTPAVGRVNTDRLIDPVYRIETVTVIRILRPLLLRGEDYLDSALSI